MSQAARARHAEAAQLACRTFLKQVAGRQAKQLSSPANWMTWLRSVDEAVRWIPWRDIARSLPWLSGRMTVIGAASGDCAALAYSFGEEPQVLTGRQQKNPPVGSGSACFTPFAAALASPWALLLCSDGVWKYAGWDTLLCLDSRQAGEALIATLPAQKAMLPRTGALQDDFTLVVLQG